MANKEMARGVKVIAPFRREALKNGHDTEMSPVRQNALEQLLRTRVIDRSIGKGDIPFPIVPGNSLDVASYKAILDLLDVTMRHKLSTDSVKNPIFAIDDDLEKITEGLLECSQHDVKSSLVVVLVDRERGTLDELKKRGYDAHSVFTATQINEFCKKNGYMTPKECSEMQSVIEKNRPFNGVGLA